MKTRYLVVRVNEKIEGSTYSPSSYINSLVRIIDGKLVVKVYGTQYEGKDFRELQNHLSSGCFPYIIEEFAVAEATELTELGNLYQQ